MIQVLVAILFQTLVTQSKGQVATPGSCPRIKPQQDFDIRRHLGVWYEAEKYIFLPQITGTCIYARYKDLGADNVTYNVDIVQVETISRKHIVSASSGRIISNDGSADMDLKVNIAIPWSPVTVTVDYPYYILDTDYETYTIKWSCREVKGFNAQSIWVLTRTRNYPPELRHHVHEILRNAGLRPDYLQLSDQSNCPMPREKEDELLNE